MSTDKFIASIHEGYQFKGPAFILGTGIYNGEHIRGAQIKIPLKTLNRHGLIAGATGTGKTITLQVFAEQLSQNGVPCLLMDIKGDLSGIAKPGSTNKHVEYRCDKIGIEFEPKSIPVEFLTISQERGVRLRATTTEFGPVLLSKILELNDTQGGVISVIFKYCDDNNIPLLDIKDLKKILQYSINEGKDDIQKEYGNIAATSVNSIFRKIVELEQQGAEDFFGEPSFDSEDLIRIDREGNGILSVIRLTDIQDRPKLFSTFMLSLMAEIYATFPEQGDSERPKLCIFIDEAHLVFDNASRSLLNQIETIIKLIRSKGVGIFFITQHPTDVPDSVLSQLGLKVQHSLRAFTAKDRTEIRKTAQNYPLSEYYNTEEILTSLGIGEALVTTLNEKGIPTPLAATLIRPPMTRMGILTDVELDEAVSRSVLVAKYNKVIDSDSAHEILTRKIEHAKASEPILPPVSQKAPTSKGRKAKKVSPLEQVSKNTMVRQIGRTVFRELTRGLLGAIGGKRR
jgi:uncharacterized protein